MSFTLLTCKPWAKNYLDAVRIESFENQAKPIGASRGSTWSIIARKVFSKRFSANLTEHTKYEGLDLNKTLVNGRVLRFAFPDTKNRIVENNSNVNRNIKSKISVKEDYKNYVALFSGSSIYTGESLVTQLKKVNEASNLAIARANENIYQVGEIDIYYQDNLQMEAIRDEVDSNLKSEYGSNVKINHKISPSVKKELMKKNDEGTDGNHREALIIRFKVKEKTK